MARWFYVLCTGFIALMLVVDVNGCDCSRLNMRRLVCSSGSCTRSDVENAQERCLLRCKKKRTDPTEHQGSTWQHQSGRTSEQLWNEVAEQQSGDSQCLLDDIYHKLDPVWQERLIKFLKSAAEDGQK
ncbi:uncharacterized protein LOC110974619 [Acanthaster planci]|uniref:Uncharacterized protein LOC110974619 n=1 Tax=Acanthaster planci TaxID=133434 RepID=A0A8B7XPK2_ACAPL|nr:uncharacterized protein LOC110974619 [Acanthaster planci]